MFSVLVEIAERRHALTQVEKRIADIVVEHAEWVTQATIKQLAIRASASEAAVVRFSRTIGLRGFRDLKIQLARELDGPVGSQQGMTLSDPVDERIAKIFQQAVYALDRTERLIEAAAVQEAAVCLKAASYILLVEACDSVVMTVFKQKLAHLNKRTEVVHDKGAAASAIVHMSKGDVIFTAERTESFEELLSYARSKEVRVIALGQPSYADIKLLTYKEEDNYPMLSMTEYLTQVVVIDCVFAVLCGLMEETVMHYISGLEEVQGIVAAKGRPDENSRENIRKGPLRRK
ncbi:MurR/RpiR family transcriptional regulator [Macrococcus equipercicus]|uniref:MurR/RpiR family transcriptional regulator n=1 Tax=Macrococcus equipercicus TaxID=69967 RepID=A0A9Q9F343_9STAP|nr:MurR/RpiR family transcriptional regulator [Macrococcus equipercicus]UTH13499.1 MurR/RpiR family transcriptional regulator [Macrococcus equipercicus]